jgi:hypothetical protein
MSERRTVSSREWLLFGLLLVSSLPLLAAGHQWHRPASIQGYAALVVTHALLQAGLFASSRFLIARRTVWIAMMVTLLLYAWPVFLLDAVAGIDVDRFHMVPQRYYGLSSGLQLAAAANRLFGIGMALGFGIVLGAVLSRRSEALRSVVTLSNASSAAAPGSTAFVDVVVPMYNEVDSVQLLLQNLDALRRNAPANVRLRFILVDDGSVDGTSDALVRSIPVGLDVEVVRCQRNNGFGAAFQTGAAQARGDILVCYDADCTYPVLDILKLVAGVRGGYDCVTALPSFPAAGRVPALRRLMTAGNSYLHRLVTNCARHGAPVFSCAFRAYRREALNAVGQWPSDFGAASEIMGRLLLRRARVAQIESPLSARRYGASKMRILSASVTRVAVLWRLLLADAHAR